MCICTSKRNRTREREERKEYWYGWSNTSHYVNRSWNCSNKTFVSHKTSKEKREKTRTKRFVCLDMYIHICLDHFRLKMKRRKTKWRIKWTNVSMRVNRYKHIYRGSNIIIDCYLFFFSFSPLCLLKYEQVPGKMCHHRYLMRFEVRNCLMPMNLI